MTLVSYDIPHFLFFFFLKPKILIACNLEENTWPYRKLLYQRITVLMKERIYNVEHKTWEVFKHKAFNVCENRRNFHGCFYENNQGRFCRKMKAATWWVSWEKVLLNVRLKHLKTTYSRVDFLVIFRMQACNFNKNELISQEFFKYFNRRFNWFLLGKLIMERAVFK